MQPNKTNSFTTIMKVVVALILIGSIAFSIIRNVRGLESWFPGVNFYWQIVIACVITFGSFALTASSILKTFTAQTSVRVFLFLAGIAFSAGSFMLSYGGAEIDSQNAPIVLATQDPAILRIEGDINDVVKRQKAHGVTEPEKQSLMTREKELREELRQERSKVNHDARVTQEENEKAQDEKHYAALALFCGLPEIGILVFTIIFVLLSGISVFNNSQHNPALILPTDTHQSTIAHQVAINPEMLQQIVSAVVAAQNSPLPGKISEQQTPNSSAEQTAPQQNSKWNLFGNKS